MAVESVNFTDLERRIGARFQHEHGQTGMLDDTTKALIQNQMRAISGLQSTALVATGTLAAAAPLAPAAAAEEPPTAQQRPPGRPQRRCARREGVRARKWVISN